MIFYKLGIKVSHEVVVGGWGWGWREGVEGESIADGTLHVIATLLWFCINKGIPKPRSKLA